MEANEFKDLISRYLDGKASETEAQLVENYLDSFPVPDWNDAEMGDYADVKAAVWSKVNRQLPIPSKKPTPSRWLRWTAAAAVLVAVATAGILLLHPAKDNTPAVTAKLVKDIAPGANKAYVTLGSGKLVVLDTVKPGQRIGEAVMGADGKLVYDQPNAAILTYNTITVPRGAMPRQVELPDHSLVWLNSESSIHYPTAFTGTTRQVDITGEVYFEVAKNGKPFIVQTRTDRIEVMGTHFNINSYLEEGAVKTTLLEGKVKVGNAVLAPNEQYAGGQTRQVSEAAVQRIMAWKNGLFSYDKVDVQTLMRDLGRYYDMEVVFEGAPTRRTFEGEIGRSLTLKEVLEGLHFTELNYRLEKGDKGNRIVMLPE